MNSLYAYTKRNYIRLKQLGGVHTTFQKRVHKEINILKKNGYIVLQEEEEGNGGYNLRIQSPAEKIYDIFLPPNYPFDEPMINGKYTYGSNEWDLRTQIIDIIIVLEEFTKMGLEEFTKMLVYCHTKQIDLFDKSHWQNEYFINLLIDQNHDPKRTLVESIDITGTPTYLEDGFNDEFIDRHLEEYDVVVLPDCGGKWFEYQENSEDELMITLIEKIFKLVKQSGVLRLGKIMREGLPDKIMDHFKSDFEVKKTLEEGLEFIDIYKNSQKY